MKMLLALVVVAQMAGAQMPDPKQMSGVPLPSGDLPVGTLTVRVIQGSLDKPIVGLSVELTGDKTTRGETNQSGRAEFSGLPPGATVTAVAVVNGERLASQPLRMPASGGLRVMLVATDPELEQRKAEDQKLAQGPAQRGTVVLGGQSRFIFEIGDGGLNIFNIFQVLNTARVPIDPGQPLVFTLPEGSEHAAMMEGSTPLARVIDGRVEVSGPFPPGATTLQFAYTLPYSGSHVTLRQTLPAQLSEFTVIAQKVGEVHLASPQMTDHGEREAQGQRYIVGQGAAIAAGGAAEFTLSGLPHAATWPRNLALGLALTLLLAGAFYSLRTGPGPSAAAERQRLEVRREQLFDELMALEAGHREGRIDQDVYTNRRPQLIASLERVYAALDEQAAA